MRSHLQTLEAQVGDESVFSSARPDIAPIIKRSLHPLYHDLTELKETLNQHNEYNRRKASVHVLDKARYLMLYKAKLKGFGDKLPGHRESICLMRDLIEEQEPGERRKSIVRLGEICEERRRTEERVKGEMLRVLEEEREGSGNTGEGGDDLVDIDVEQQEEKEQVSSQEKPVRACGDQTPLFDLDIFDRMAKCKHAGHFDSTKLSTLSPGADDVEPMHENVLIGQT